VESGLVSGRTLPQCSLPFPPPPLGGWTKRTWEGFNEPSGCAPWTHRLGSAARVSPSNSSSSLHVSHPTRFQRRNKPSVEDIAGTGFVDQSQLRHGAHNTAIAHRADVALGTSGPLSTLLLPSTSLLRRERSQWSTQGLCTLFSWPPLLSPSFTSTVGTTAICLVACFLGQSAHRPEHTPLVETTRPLSSSLSP